LFLSYRLTTATTAISDFLQLGFSDGLGYFDPSALLTGL
jgi:hypothetical protein